jgi:hypothetical protein
MLAERVLAFGLTVNPSAAAFAVIFDPMQRYDAIA